MVPCLVPLMLVALFASPERQPTSISYNVKDYTLQRRFIFSEVNDSTVAAMSPVPLMGRQVAQNRLRKRAVKRRPARIDQDQNKRIEDILTDQSLWGANFPSVLGSIPAFSRAGEKQISVFPDRVIGRTKYTGRGEVELRLARFARELIAAQNLNPRSTRIGSYMTSGRTALKAEVFQLPDDRTLRISAVGPSAQFLAPGLTIADVERRLGKEEKVTTEVLDDGTERRPIILTLHHYAGGAIIFVESDVNPNIGSVDRVFLDASKISASLF